MLGTRKPVLEDHTPKIPETSKIDHGPSLEDIIPDVGQVVQVDEAVLDGEKICYSFDWYQA